MKHWVNSLRQSFGAERQSGSVDAATAPHTLPTEVLDWPSIDELLAHGLLPTEPSQGDSAQGTRPL